MAYRLTDRLAVGLGTDIFTFASFLGEGQLEQKLIWPGGLGIPAGSRVDTLAVAGWPIRDTMRAWKVEVYADYVRWSSLRDLDIRLSNGTVLSNPQDWDDAITVGIGTEYRWRRLASLPGWDVALRAATSGR